MILKIIFIWFLVSILLTFVWIEVKDHFSERKHCVACRTGSVLFTDDDDTLCYPHYNRRRHIRLLEWKMDRLDE